MIFGSSYTLILEYIIPWYFLLCGLMIGYVISQIALLTRDSDEYNESIQMKIFVIWLGIGIILALLYIFLQ